jgi:hypothetical protein
LGTGSEFFGEAQRASRKGCGGQKKSLSCTESALASVFVGHVAETRILHGKEGQRFEPLHRCAKATVSSTDWNKPRASAWLRRLVDTHVDVTIPLPA